ncbi:MAG: adenylyl-sulfate kinase [Actinobacteria bacterium]|nr:adenylyl-sulfate kinase [Actinomycetota bacterium]
MNKPANIVWHKTHIDKAKRSRVKNHKPCVVWFTGLSCSGKSTIANALEERLNKMGHHTYLLDGDNIRHGLNKDLGFSEKDRNENIRRISEVAKLFVDAGIITLCAFISPFKETRKKVRGLFESGEFIEVFIDAPLEVCEQRDTKGHYKKARSGEIREFTGISSPYEPPDNPEVHLDTAKVSIEKAVEIIINYLESKLIISSDII